MVHYRNKAKQYNKETLKYDMPKNSGMTSYLLQEKRTQASTAYNSTKYDI